MVSLDLKDRKILYELDKNSRQPFSSIAKTVGLSKDSVIYRIKNLRKEGIIKQFHTVIDSSKLGFIPFRLYLKLQNTTPKKENDIIKFLKSQKIVVWFVSIDGAFDLGAWILTKSINEMNQLWKELLEKYINYIDEKWLTIPTRIHYFPRCYLLDIKHNDEYCDFITDSSPVNLDRKDVQIVKLLAPNARMSALHMAKKLDITPKTVIARIHKLEKMKVITGYKTRFDIEKIGYKYFKLQIDLHNVTKEKKRRLQQYIKAHPNIIFDEEILGGNDIDIEMQVKGFIQYKEILEDMKSKFSDIIKDHRRMVFYKEHKSQFFPIK